MQAGNSNNSDGDRRHAKQQEMITKVVTWLKEGGTNEAGGKNRLAWRCKDILQWSE